ncbi:MAG: OmpA family protein [Brevinematia bacterium]
MKKEPIIIFVFLLFPVFCIHGWEFSWKLSTNEILRVKSFVKQNIYTNNSFVKYVEILNKASIDVKSESISGGKRYYGIEGKFYVFSKDYLYDREFKLEETFLSKYLLEESGRMVISKEHLMPVTRDVPVFVKRNIDLGEEWTYQGKEVHKIGFAEIYDVVEVTFKVHYKFSEITNIDNYQVAVLDIKYGFANAFDRAKVVRYLAGSSETKYYWNISEGKPLFMRESYFFNAIYNNGVSVVYSGTSEGTLEVIRKLEREKEKEILSSLTNVFKNQESVEITKGESEINVSVQDIVFDFNSYKVKQEFVSVLSNFAISLKNYKELDIIVEGHTDDIGSEKYNLELSEARAREVAKILVELGVDPSKVSYIGYGEKKPKVPNNSPENRAKNRRVEIKLIWGK